MPKKSYLNVSFNTFGFLIFGPILMSFLLLIFVVGYYNFTSISPFDQPFLIYFVISLLFVSVLNSYIEYKVKGYYFTGDSVCFKQGFWNAKYTTIPFLKIDNASVNQTIFQRVFGVSSILFEQNDSSESFDDISLEISTKILNEVSKRSGKLRISK